MDENPDGTSISLKKREANRRNAQMSTGPKTEDGKAWSRRNSLKHGILASALLITQGDGAEDQTEFDELLGGLHRDFAPVGMFEEMLVEKIAVCWWRQKRALLCEAGLVGHTFVTVPSDPLLESYKERLRLPFGENLDRILRYETTIQRQLAYAINQLERLQRARKGEHVPAPVNVQVSSDQ
jgi:hypothetical protein